VKGFQDINFENEAKIRKAIVSVSVFTLVISNVELASNKLDFFGLEVVISIEKISAVFRLLIVSLLLGLFLVLAEHSPKRIVRILRVRDEKWWDRVLPAIREFQEFQNNGHDRSDQED
jgi:hypothetical protein